MARVEMSKDDVAKICRFAKTVPMSLALIKTEHAPTELMPVLKSVGRSCGMKLKRTSWSPSADFGFAEFNSKDRILIVLWVGGDRTELISVSATDEVFVEDMEEALHSSKFYSEIVRHGT